MSVLQKYNLKNAKRAITLLEEHPKLTTYLALLWPKLMPLLRQILSWVNAYRVLWQILSNKVGLC